MTLRRMFAIMARGLSCDRSIESFAATTGRGNPAVYPTRRYKHRYACLRAGWLQDGTPFSSNRHPRCAPTRHVRLFCFATAGADDVLFVAVTYRADVYSGLI